jgi:hypothetical protein
LLVECMPILKNYHHDAVLNFVLTRVMTHDMRI